jgi:oligopeptidase A
MADDVAAVDKMYDELFAAAQPHMRQDHQALTDFAQQHGQTEPLEHADLAFWAERMREDKFGFTDDDLRPYFPMPRVLDGLFGLCQRLFGIQCEPVQNEPSIWHEDALYYNVRNEAGDLIAGFYLDPYSRPQEKRGGAWMDECLNRRWIDGELHLPVVHLCCNGTPPVGDTPSLMSFREVETLFHEFGHGLQGMLTTVDYADAAGLHGIEYDAIELASQFMENWCYHKPTLTGMTAHHDTGQPLPDDLFEKICAARTYREGTQMMRQLELGMTDLRLHHNFDPDGDQTPFELHRGIAQETSPLPPTESNRFLNAFTHIFAGGYAAGYYVYKWSEVLSADAFAAFEEAGLDNEQAVHDLGRKYRDTILSMGGSRHPMDVYRDFRGREPNTAALLRHSGLAE